MHLRKPHSLAEGVIAVIKRPGIVVQTKPNTWYCCDNCNWWYTLPNTHHQFSNPPPWTTTMEGLYHVCLPCKTYASMKIDRTHADSYITSDPCLDVTCLGKGPNHRAQLPDSQHVFAHFASIHVGVLNECECM